MSTEENKELVRMFLKCLADRDAASAMKLTTDDLTWCMGGEIEFYPAKSTSHSKSIASMFDDLLPESRHGSTIEPIGMISEGGKVSCEAVSRGQVANGNAYDTEYHILFTFREGKIASAKAFIGMLYAGAARQGESSGGREGAIGGHPGGDAFGSNGMSAIAESVDEFVAAVSAVYG